MHNFNPYLATLKTKVSVFGNFDKKNLVFGGWEVIITALQMDKKKVPTVGRTSRCILQIMSKFLQLFGSGFNGLLLSVLLLSWFVTSAVHVKHTHNSHLAAGHQNLTTSTVSVIQHLCLEFT